MVFLLRIYSPSPWFCTVLFFSVGWHSNLFIYAKFGFMEVKKKRKRISCALHIIEVQSIIEQKYDFKQSPE